MTAYRLASGGLIDRSNTLKARDAQIKDLDEAIKNLL